jgi:putative FmdB family regulatory protein
MIYEYRCDYCAKVFEVRASMAEKERGLRLKCPRCGTPSATQVFSAVNVITRSGRGDAPPPFCAPGSGPGCCG